MPSHFSTNMQVDGFDGVGCQTRVLHTLNSEQVDNTVNKQTNKNRLGEVGGGGGRGNSGVLPACMNTVM